MAIADSRLFRHDLDSGTTAIRDFGPGRHPGEFAFVPRIAEGAEDDGWLVGLVVDMTDEQTDLLILNADDFSGPPPAVMPPLGREGVRDRECQYEESTGS